MDTFTTVTARPTSGHRHQSAQGFCTVCGTAWPCWSGLREGRETVRVSAPPVVASIGVLPW
jgi:hypothetical protein